MPKPDLTMKAAGAMCYQCKHNGKPEFGTKGGGDSVIQKPKLAWWHTHGDYQTECKASGIWTAAADMKTE